MRVKQRIKNLKLQKKILFSNLIFSVVPCLILMSLLVYAVNSDGNRRLNQSRLVILNQINAGLDNIFRDVITGSDFFYSSGEINRLISRREYDSEYDCFRNMRRVQELLHENRIKYHNHYFLMELLGENGMRWFSEKADGEARRHTDFERIKQEDWYQELPGTSRMKFIPSYRSEAFSQMQRGSLIQAVRVVKNFHSGRSVALLNIDIPAEIILTLFRESMQAKQEILLLDEQGWVVACTDAEMAEISLADEDCYSKLRDNDHGYFPADMGGMSAQVCFVTNGTTGWKTVLYAPAQSRAWSGYRNYILILGVAAVYFILAVTMSIYNSHYISRPVRKLKDDIRTIYQGDLNVRTRIGAMDEFGELGVQFNEMMDRIQGLIAQLKERDEEKRVLELQALQAQINPHFLYNTLASIRFLVEMNREEQASQSLLALARLLKGTFSDHRRLIPLREEMDSLENYLILMNNRYQDAFTWSLVLDPAAEKLLIPRIALQPLAENAISHGLNTGGGAGHILVEACRRGEELVVRVSDNGVDGDLERIREILGQPSTVGRKEWVSGIGIRNVHERIRLFFGESYGLTAEKLPDGGICFTVRLPAQTEDPQGSEQ